MEPRKIPEVELPVLGMTTTSDPGTSGIKDIADALGGGVRENSLVLIEGAPRTGKSVLSQHIAYGIMNARGSAVTYFTTDLTPDGLVKQMDSMSLETRHDMATDRFRIYHIFPVGTVKEMEKILRLIVDHICTLPPRFKCVIVDSPSAFMTRLNPALKVDFLQSCKELCEQGRSIVLTLNTHVFESRTLLRAYAIGDYYIKLKSQDSMLAAGQVDTRMIKVLEVTKLGGVERYGAGGQRFEIRPGVGIQILPFVQIRI
jgi:flagellar protein FlaH